MNGIEFTIPFINTFESLFITYNSIYVVEGFMLYFVKKGDTLYKIARRFKVGVQDILDANAICNPGLILQAEPLIIPKRNLELPKAGGLPYYIVMPEDNLYCIATQFNTTMDALAEGNDIKNPSLIDPGKELLITYEKPNPEELFNSWKATGDKYCGEMSPLQLHGIYYAGSFVWEGLGSEGIPYLNQLLNHPCAEVRFYAVLSMGRIAEDERIILGLNDMLKDPDENVRNIAALAFKRMILVKEEGKRIHVVLGDSNRLLLNPIYTSPSINVTEGTTIKVLKWRIPSPTGEEGPKGDIQIYDYVQLMSTGQIGFLPRIAYNEIAMI